MTPSNLLESGADALIRASWQGAILAILVLGVCGMFRHIPARWRCGLWLLVLARLLLPITPHSPISVFNVASVVMTSSGLRSEAHEEANFDTVPAQVAGTAAADGPRLMSPGSMTPQPLLSSVPDRGISSRLASILCAVWALGVLVMIAHWIVLMLRLRRLLRGCRVIDSGAIRDALETCRAQLGIHRRIGLLVTDGLTTPALAGLIRPRIIVSARTLATLNREELHWLFRHELAHIRRRDVAIQYLWCWARAIHWFNPLVWWAASRARMDTELACDESILARATRPQRVGYGNALLKVAEIMIDANSAPGAIAFLTRKSALAKRIGVIASDRQHSRFWTLVASLFFISLACMGLTDAVQRRAESAPASQTSAAATEDAPSEVDTPKSAENNQEIAKRTIGIQVLGPDGQPLSGAKIHASVWTKDPFQANRDYVCDLHGQTTVELPQTIDILRLWARMKGHVALFANWGRGAERHLGPSVPEKYTFQLEKGTIIGGGVKNEDGKSIEGAKVEVMLVDPASLVDPGGEKPEKYPIPNTWLAYDDDARITDAEGLWTLDNVPAGDSVEVRLRLVHPDYVSDYSWGGLQREQNVTTRSFREQTGTIVMHRGISVTGAVVNEAGNPVRDAVVVWGDDPYFQLGSQEAKTDRHGVYRFPPLLPGPIAVTAIGEGWAPEKMKIDIAPQMPPVDFHLKPGKTIRIRFVDRSGAPIPYVYVGIERWRDGQSLYNHRHPNVLDTRIPYQADSKGVYEWRWAPDDAVSYYFSGKDQQEPTTQSFTAGDDEHTVVLQPK